ncbi:hypothetical protein [Tenacibaculum sp. 190524A05c]|uniref:Uncharacterized protein n=1 Tax=Tenacibaculum platacis TaxID=3137852 RepID=A0ABP1EGR7_9FLAO
MIFLKIFFYSIYKFTLLTPSKNEEPEQITNIVLSLLSAFNLLFLLKFFKAKGYLHFEVSGWLIGGFYFIFMTIIYFNIIKGGKYNEMVEKYDSLKNINRYLIHSLTIVWVVFTIVLVVKKGSF